MTSVNLVLGKRFWSRVQKTQTCWLWTGAKRNFGYGAYSFFGKSERAHRVMWFVHHGAIPEGKVVRHKCDNPSCVNPDHLVLGTQADNGADRVERNRQYRPTGDKHHRRKLSSVDVRAIKERMSRNESPAGIAREYKVHKNTVYAIKYGRSWKSVDAHV